MIDKFIERKNTEILYAIFMELITSDISFQFTDISEFFIDVD